jgi:WD40 repeat protein
VTCDLWCVRHVRLWDVSTGECRHSESCDQGIWALALLPDGRLVTGGFKKVGTPHRQGLGLNAGWAQRGMRSIR